MRVIAHHDVNLMFAWIEIVEQTLGVKRAAGSGDGDKNFQARKLWRADESGARFPWRFSRAEMIGGARVTRALLYFAGASVNSISPMSMLPVTGVSGTVKSVFPCHESVGFPGSDFPNVAAITVIS